MSKHKLQMTNQCQNPKKAKYDLEERTAKFGEAIIESAQSLPRNIINSKLTPQLVDSGTSIGANYMKTGGAESKKDFRHKISLCKKESKETKYWLSMIAKFKSSKRQRKQKVVARGPGCNPDVLIYT